MSTVAERWTADAYLARADERHTELLDGTIIVNQLTVLHQRVCARIHEALSAWTRSADGSGEASWPLDVVLDDGTVLAPDVLWLADTASRTMLVYRRSGPRAVFDVSRELGADELLDSPLLVGFTVLVGELIPALA